MPDLNVDVKRTFGKYLPTSFIKKVDIKQHPGAPDKYSIAEITVDVNLTVRKEVVNIREAIAKHLEGLHLYITCTNFGIFHRNLKIKKFNVKNYFNYNSTVKNSTISTIHEQLVSGGTSVTKGEVKKSILTNFTKIKLEDLKTRITEEGLYDIHGDRIIKISNVKATVPFLNVIADRVPATTVITFVGTDDSLVRRLPDVVANRNFGDIAFENILQFNKVPDTTQEIYVDIDGNQYTGTPLQTIQGSYHVSEPISHAIVIDNIRNLQTAYAETGTGDGNPVLMGTFMELRYLLATSERNIQMLPSLNLYRKSYPDKSNGTVPGRFYDLFKRRLLQWNSRVAQQDKLYKKLVLNSKTSDLRSVDAELYSVVTPNPDPAELPLSYDDYFISKEMINIDRTTQLTIPLKGAVSDFVQFVAEEGVETYDKAQALWNAKYDNMFAASLDEQRGEVMTGLESSTVQLKVPPNQIAPITEADTVVKNKGLFFFDWERALHVKSAIAKVFRLDYLQRFLGMHVPYEYFRLKFAQVKRIESTFVTQNDPDDTESWKKDPYWFSSLGGAATPDAFTQLMDPTYGGFENFLTNPDQATVTLTANFNMAANYPKQTTSDWRITCHQHESYLAYGMPYVYKVIYGALDTTSTAPFAPYEYNSPYMDMPYAPSEGGGFMPYFYVGTDSYLGVLDVPAFARSSMATANNASIKARVNSYIKLKNFDLPRENYEDRLSGYNGSKVRGGYRLMCFEFQDFMDDDVAYYNTVGSFFGDRQKHETSYYMDIGVLDVSLDIYHKVKQLLELEYSKFIVYVEKAKEACSYNNIDDVFNEFFIAAMSELEESGSVVSWYRAPTIYYSFMAVISNMYAGIHVDDIRAHIVNDITSTAGLISPQTGRMSEILVFKKKFEHLLGMFRSRLIDPSKWGPLAGAVEDLYLDAGGVIGAGASNPTYNLRFKQEHPIEEEIFGNLYLSAWETDDISLNDLSNIEISEPDIEGIGDGPVEAPDFVDTDAHLKGIDLRLAVCDWKSNVGSKRDYVKIFAGDYWENPFTGPSWSSAPSGYEAGQELEGYEHAVKIPEKSYRTVYLPPGRWTVALYKYSELTSNPDYPKNNWITVYVPSNSVSPNRIRRTSGAGHEYTEHGKGPAAIQWPMRNGSAGPTTWSTDSSNWLIQLASWGGMPNAGSSSPYRAFYYKYNISDRDTCFYRVLQEDLPGSRPGDADHFHYSLWNLEFGRYYVP